MRDLSFHDAIITAVTRTDDDLVLHVEGVTVQRSAGQPHGFDLVAGTLTFAGVQAVTFNAQRATTIAMGGDDGEIIKLDWYGGGEATMSVIWSHYSERQQPRTHALYKIACADLAWTTLTKFHDS
jgi:hypothetical protein